MRNKGLENVPGCEYYCTSNFKIEFDDVPEFSWGLDGEEYKYTGTTFNLKVVQGPKMLLPKDNVKLLFD